MKTADAYLYYNNGKAKKKHCLCLSREKRAEMKRLYGYEIIQCAGCSCPYYSRGCGRDNIKRYEQKKTGTAQAERRADEA